MDAPCSSYPIGTDRCGTYRREPAMSVGSMPFAKHSNPDLRLPHWLRESRNNCNAPCPPAHSNLEMPPGDLHVQLHLRILLSTQAPQEITLKIPCGSRDTATLAAC